MRLATLEEVLVAHFEEEDALHYPTIGSLQPEARDRIRAIAEAHTRFRAQLGAIRGLLDRADGPAASEAFEAWIRDFSEHEREEEALLLSLPSGAANG